MPIRRAGDGAEGQRPRDQAADRDQLDDRGLDHVQREVGSGLTEHRADQQRHAAAHRDEQRDGDQRAARSRPQARGDQRHRRGEHHQHRLEEEVELRHAEVELGLEGREPDQEGAHERAALEPQHARRERLRLAAARCSRATRAPSTSSTERPTSVIAAPPISIRWVGPQSVTSWPNSRCQKSSSGKAGERERATGEQQHAADGRVPVAGDAHRAAPGPLGGEDHREEAGDEAAEQPGEDQVVRRVGERAGVAALVDVQGDVPVHPEQRDEQRDRGDRAREGRPAGQPGLALGPVGERGRAPSRGRSGDPCRAPAGAWSGRRRRASRSRSPRSPRRPPAPMRQR